MNQNSLKGLLIILVIFDHNEYAHQLFPDFLRGFSFHVLGFFALPFLREADSINLPRLRKMFFSYLYPFLWFAGSMSIVTLFFKLHFSFNDLRGMLSGMPSEMLSQILLALYSGNAILLKAATGMSLLWFLPSFFSLMLMRGLLADRKNLPRSIALLCLFFIHPFIGLLPFSMQVFFPFGLLAALYAMPLVMLLVIFQRQVYEKLQALHAIFLSVLLFSAIKYLQIQMNLTQELGFVDVANYQHWRALLVNDLEGMFGVLMLFQLARYDLSTLINACGKYSLQLYLFHAFIALVIYRLLEKYLAGTHIGFLLLLSMLATIVISLGFVTQLMKINRVQNLLFPKN
jgi:hypothetical protein